MTAVIDDAAKKAFKNHEAVRVLAYRDRQAIFAFVPPERRATWRQRDWGRVGDKNEAAGAATAAIVAYNSFGTLS